MALPCTRSCQRGRLRWAEPPKLTGQGRGIVSASDFDSEDSMSLAVSSDTAATAPWPGSARLPKGDARWSGHDAFTELQARCRSLESESSTLRREFSRMQELRHGASDSSPSTAALPPPPPAPRNVTHSQLLNTERRRGVSPTARKALIARAPLLPSSGPLLPRRSCTCPTCGARRAGGSPARTCHGPSTSSSSSSQANLEEQIAELRTELGVMALKAMQDRQNQASQISRLEKEVQDAERRAQEMRDNELADEAAAEFERAAARRLETAKELTQVVASASPSAHSARLSPPDTGRGSTPASSSQQSGRGAGPLPKPPSFKGLSAPAEHTSSHVVPLFEAGADAFRTADLDQRTEQLLTALGTNTARASSSASLLPTAWGAATPFGGVSVSPLDSLLGSWGLGGIGSATPQAGPLIQGASLNPFMMTHSDCLQVSASSQGQCPPSSMILPFAAPHIGSGPLPAAGQIISDSDFAAPCPVSSTAPSVALAAHVAAPEATEEVSQATKETEHAEKVPEPQPAARASPEESPMEKLEDDLEMANTCDIGSDEEVAKKMYKRFGLEKCVPFEKFLQLQANRLPCEVPKQQAPRVRPSTGGA